MKREAANQARRQEEMRRQREFERQIAIGQMMERRFFADRDLLIRTLLWRMRRYCDNCEPEKADVLAELLPPSIVRGFYDWYYDGEGFGPMHPLRKPKGWPED